MGIKGLTAFLRKQCKDVFHQENISLFRHKMITVDASLYIYKYKSIYQDKWLQSVLNLVLILRKADVHCMFIFDGNCPEEKLNERKIRSERKNDTTARADLLELDLATYIETGIISDNMQAVYEKELKNVEVKPLLSQRNQACIASVIEQKINKLRGSVVKMTSNDTQALKELCDAMKIPYMTANGEAEKLCAILTQKKVADAVLTDDSDVIAYGASLVITQLNVQTGECTVIVPSEVTDHLQVTYEQFVDFCIMCGTDFNSNIAKIGPVKAFKLIQTFGSIEQIEKNEQVDVSCLNYVRVRELISDGTDNGKIVTGIKTIWCGRPDVNKVKLFAVTNNIRVSESQIEESCCVTKITIK